MTALLLCRRCCVECVEAASFFRTGGELQYGAVAGRQSRVWEGGAVGPSATGAPRAAGAGCRKAAADQAAAFVSMHTYLMLRSVVTVCLSVVVIRAKAGAEGCLKSEYLTGVCKDKCPKTEVYVTPGNADRLYKASRSL